MVKQKKKASAYNSLNSSGRSLIYDEVDDFNDVESEESDDYNSNLITEPTKKEYVLGLSESSDESDESDDGEFFRNDKESEGDEEEEEKAIIRSMGTNKKRYFGTDLTDQRFHNAAKIRNKRKGDEDEALEIEKQGAIELQHVMNANKISSSLFGIFSANYDQKLDRDEENTLQENLKQIETNTSYPGDFQDKKKDKKLKKIAREWPKLEVTLEDIVEETNTKLSPLIQAHRKNLLSSSSATKYLVTRYYLNLNYVTCLSAYMMLKSSGVDMAHHPAEKRLTQFKHLYKEIELCKEKYEDDLNAMLKDLESGKLKQKKRKMLGLIKEKTPSEPLLANTTDENKSWKEGEMSSEEENSYRDEEIGEEKDTWKYKGDRRLITYDIMKNKGLLPSRKREQRNPRVKYKKKYQNKLKKRKGQVREVRKEIKKYGGEISGIKSNLIKSIKLH